MEEDYFTYKVFGWLVLMLLTLQPTQPYDSLSDEWTASVNAGAPFYQEIPASIDEARPLQTFFALRLRSQHVPEPGVNPQPGRSAFFPAHHSTFQSHIPSGDFIRRRSTLCTYRI